MRACGANNFAGIFEGNHSIYLYSRGGGVYVGLFKSTTSRASIRNLGVVDANLYGPSANQSIGALVGLNRGNIRVSYTRGGTVNNDSVSGNLTNVGGLVGLNQGGNIVTSHVRDCTVNGGAGDDVIGGLVGSNKNGSTIIASHATGCTINVVGGSFAGGLVGIMFTGTITASYATGAIHGGAGSDDVGGLVGSMGVFGSSSGTNTITASYATGAVNGGAGSDQVGGLVGFMTANTNSITASYATGATNGGVGRDGVGGLVGFMAGGTNTITASYATGDANGDVGNDDAGALVGEVTTGAGTTNTITHSYGFSNVAKEYDGNDGTAHPAGLSGSGAAKANGLTAPVGREYRCCRRMGPDCQQDQGRLGLLALPAKPLP